jgi:hypothetical protein
MAALCGAALPLRSQTALTITPSSLIQANVGQFYVQGFSVNGGTAPYTWTASGQVPPGLTVNSTGTLTGTPTTAGTYTFTLTVTDATKATASKSLSLVVVSSSISITASNPLPPAAVGQNYSYIFSASSGVPPYRWSATSDLPAGMALASNGVLSGMPTTAGTYSLSVQVTDAQQSSAAGNFSLTVSAPSLSITTTTIFNGAVGSAYAQSFSASGGASPYTWSLASGSVPGLAFNAATATLQGTPTTTGTYPIRVQVTDSAGAQASQSYQLVITQPVLSITTSGQLPAGTVGVGYSQKLPVTATGGTAPYVWAVSGSQSGLTFDASSLVLSGTPSTAGTFTLTVQVTDATGATANKNLTLTINAAGLSLTSSRQLPDGLLNAAYSTTITANGGITPYTWSANGLPTGLSINSSTGVISGTPTAAGSFGIAITVSDTTLTRVSDRFTMTISLPQLPAVTFSGLPATVSPAQQYSLQIGIASAYTSAITGQAILTFSPDSGPADKTIQFASGGTTANFTIAAGSTTATSDVPLAIQTGTVSGTLSISLRLQAGVDITPNPAPVISAQIARAAPVISNVQVTRSSSGISVIVTGYCTAREVTQAVFSFKAASGQTLQTSASSITVDVSSLFGTWFQDSNNSQYGTQFIFTQPFSVQGDPTAVIPVSVVLTNRIGSVTANISQ